LRDQEEAAPAAMASMARRKASISASVVNQPGLTLTVPKGNVPDAFPLFDRLV